VEVATSSGPLTARSAIIAVGRPAAARRLLAADPGWGDLGPELTAACLDAGLRRVPDPGYVLGLDAPVYATVQSPPARQAPPGHAVVAAIRYRATEASADRAVLEVHLARRPPGGRRGNQPVPGSHGRRGHGADRGARRARRPAGGGRHRAAGGAHIVNSEAWLVTAATRLCLDRLRSAARTREIYPGPWLPEPIVTDPGPECAAEYPNP
jgi:hypothetical protein